MQSAVWDRFDELREDGGGGAFFCFCQASIFRSSSCEFCISVETTNSKYENRALIFNFFKARNANHMTISKASILKK